MQRTFLFWTCLLTLTASAYERLQGPTELLFHDKDTHNQPRQVSKQIVPSYRSANSHGFFSHLGSSG